MHLYSRKKKPSHWIVENKKFQSRYTVLRIHHMAYARTSAVEVRTAIMQSDCITCVDVWLCACRAYVFVCAMYIIWLFSFHFICVTTSLVCARCAFNICLISFFLLSRLFDTFFSFARSLTLSLSCYFVNGYYYIVSYRIGWCVCVFVLVKYSKPISRVQQTQRQTTFSFSNCIAKGVRKGAENEE